VADNTADPTTPPIESPKTIGPKVYAMPPQPPDPAATRWLPAGVVTIGVEYREVNPENLAETYKDNAAHMAEMEEKSPVGGFTDEGVSIHVSGTEDGHEYLRFDVFVDEPHYHYVHRSGQVNNVVDFDVTAHGDMLPWALDRIRHRLPEMLDQAGGGHLVAGLDSAVLGPVVDEVGELATRAQEAQRAAAGR
jgi:hypothetical protein